MKRPLGVWLLTGVYCAWAIFMLANVTYRRLYPPNCDACLSAWNQGTAQYLLLVHALILFGAVATFRGGRRGRLGLLLSVGVLIAWLIFYEVYWYITAVVMAETPHELVELSFWLTVLRMPFIATVWLAFNYWYFYKRAAKFFAPRQ